MNNTEFNNKLRTVPSFILPISADACNYTKHIALFLGGFENKALNFSWQLFKNNSGYINE